MKQKVSPLILPYGGRLMNLMVRGDEREELLKKAGAYPTVQMTPRQTHDLELLAIGAFSPLTQFMGQADYRSVLDDMRLSDGTI